MLMHSVRTNGHRLHKPQLECFYNKLVKEGNTATTCLQTSSLLKKGLYTKTCAVVSAGQL